MLVSFYKEITDICSQICKSIVKFDLLGNQNISDKCHCFLNYLVITLLQVGKCCPSSTDLYIFIFLA